MSSQDLHQVILRWPYTDANEVIVTGTFDKWSSSLRLARKPDGFEAPVFIPWKDKIAYKFIVDGRWMTNDTQPTEIDHGYVNNVYTAPSKPPPQEPKPVPAQPSHPSESQVEPGHAEKERLPQEHVANGPALDELHNVDTSAAEPKPAGSSAPVEEVKTAVTPVVESPQAAVAQVAPDPKEKVSDEIAPVTQAPEEPIPAALSPARPSPEEEPPTHVTDGSTPAVVTQVGPTTQDSGLALVDGPTEVAAVPVEKGVPSPSEADPSKEDEVVEAPVEPEPASAVAEPKTVPATEAPADDVTTTIPEEPEPVASPAPVPAVEQKSRPTKSQPPIPAAAAPEPKLDEKSSEAVVPTAPAVNGHTKSASTASTSTAVPTLPTTPTRKASHKFSFPGRDKSGNSSPTGSSRFSSQQKREKRQSLLGKLKEIFGDKEKKEKSAKA